MFVVFRKKSVIVCLILVLAVILSCVMLSYTSAEVSSVPKIGKTVVIDAGHGGVDGGVSGVNTGVKESEINLAIAKSLKHFLVRNGYDVVMTRENNDGLYGLSTKNKKHQNCLPGYPNVRGAQVFYCLEGEESKKIAESVQDTLNSSLEGDRVAKTGDYYILNCTEYPSVLVECGFLSNPEEEKLLATAVYQEKVAYTLFCAIHSLFGGQSEHIHS